MIAANLARTHLGGRRARIVRADAIAWLAGPEAAAAAPFDVVVADPPYAETALLVAALEALEPRLAPGARVVAKHFWRDAPPAAHRAASIRARASLRRDDADLLSTSGGSMNTIAVYPGSFDPITNGHLDIVARALAVFDSVVVARPRQPAEVAAALGRRAHRDHPRGAPRRGRRAAAARLDVEAFDGLTVDFCRARDAGAIVRGLRAISDFETEMQLAHNNRVLAPEIDTVFFMTVGRARLRQLEPGQGDRRRSAATCRGWSRRPRAQPWREALGGH